MRTPAQHRRRNRQRGFSMIVTTMCLIVMLGMMGLAIDVGRLYIAKAELQAYVDAAAMAAASQLDGSTTGVTKAQNMATSGPLGSQLPNGIQFDVSAIPTSSISTGFRANPTDSDTDGKTASSSSSAGSFRYVHVTATQNVNMNFIPMVGSSSNPIALTYSVSAEAIAGQTPASNQVLQDIGVAPFTPPAHDLSDTVNWGFTVNTQYAMKWGNGGTSTCTGDSGFNPGWGSSQHGYVDVGQGNGDSALGQVIEYDYCPLCPISVGTSLDGVPGNRANTSGFVQARSNQDPDQSSLTYADYVANGIGNGRRLIIVPVNNYSQVSGHGSNTSYPIIGFAEFLLLPASYYSSNTSADYCAVYVGPARTYNGGTVSSGGDGTKIYTISLYQ